MTIDMTRVWQRIRILPILVLVCLLSFGVRMTEFITGVRTGSAMAQEEVQADVPPLPTAQEIAEEEATEELAEQVLADEAAAATETMDGTATEGGGGLLPPPGSAEWRDASESDYQYSEVRAELFRDLSKRREELEKKEKALAAREALLLAAERELDQKIRELTTVQREIEGLMQEQSEEEKARVLSLVKIYEGMKAKDAARIFNTLDMDVLLSVMSGMSERKSAPILAEMNPERARSVTILLAQQNQLPTLPQ